MKVFYLFGFAFFSAIMFTCIGCGDTFCKQRGLISHGWLTRKTACKKALYHFLQEISASNLQFTDIPISKKSILLSESLAVPNGMTHLKGDFFGNNANSEEISLHEGRLTFSVHKILK